MHWIGTVDKLACLLAAYLGTHYLGRLFSLLLLCLDSRPSALDPGVSYLSYYSRLTIVILSLDGWARTRAVKRADRLQGRVPIVGIGFRSPYSVSG